MDAATNNTEIGFIPPPLTSGVLWMVAVSFPFIAVLGSFGNICVILVICKKRQLRTVSNYFTVALMAFSLMGDSVAYPLQMALDTFLITTHPQCYIAGVLIVSWTVHITLCLVAITVERYIAISRPLRKDMIVTPRRAIFVIGFITLYGYFMAGIVPGFIWIGKGDIWDIRRRCDFKFYAPSRPFALILTAHWIINIPIMTLLFIHIFIMVRRHTRQIAAMRPAVLPSNTVPSTSAAQTEVPYIQSSSAATNAEPLSAQRMTAGHQLARSALRLFIVFAIYAINWLPINLFVVNKVATAGDSADPRLYILNHILTYLVGVASPFIYGVGDKRVRAEIKGLFFGRQPDELIPRREDLNAQCNYIHSDNGPFKARIHVEECDSTNRRTDIIEIPIPVDQPTTVRDAVMLNIIEDGQEFE